MTWWGCFLAEIEEGLRVCAVSCEVRGGIGLSIGVSIGFLVSLLLREKWNGNGTLGSVEVDLCVAEPGSHSGIGRTERQRESRGREQREGTLKEGGKCIAV